ncbi:MAG: flippase-like domain-containing protein [Chloroflexi bacterium]|nr:flippase-like domain-containing protein [Chloroflexota bacterium]
MRFPYAWSIMSNELPDVGAEHRPSILKLIGWGRRNIAAQGLVAVVLTLVVLYLLLTRIDARQTLYALRDIPTQTWVAAVLLAVSSPAISAVRWHVTLRVMGHPVTVGRCLLIIIGIWPLNAISPAKAADLLKIVGLRRRTPSTVVLSSVLTERSLDILTLAAFALLGGLALREWPIVLIAASIFAAAGIAVGLAYLGTRVPVRFSFQDKVRHVLHSLRSLLHHPRALAIIVFLTAINWFGSILQVKLLFDGVGAHTPLGLTTAAMPIAIFVGLLPVTVAGMGTRDSAMIVLFSTVASASQVLSVSLLYPILNYWLLAIIGIPFTAWALDWGRPYSDERGAP